MKASILRVSDGPDLVREVLLYRQANGTLVVRLDLAERWPEVDLGLTWTGCTDNAGVERVEVDLTFWRGDAIACCVSLAPQEPSDVRLFANGCFLKQQHRHSVHVHVVPRIPVELIPERLPLEEAERRLIAGSETRAVPLLSELKDA